MSPLHVPSCYDEPQLLSVQSAMTCFACCGCAGQGFLPVLLRDLTILATALLVDRVGTQPSCLQFVLTQLEAYRRIGLTSLCSQLRKPAAGLPSVLVCGDLRIPHSTPYHLPGQESLCNGATSDWGCLLGRSLLEECLPRWEGLVG